MSRGHDAAGVLVVAASTGRVLLALRSSTVRNPGTWSVFGGGIDQGETPDEAASRELYEEAGLDYDERDFVLVHERDKGASRGGVYSTFLLVVKKEVRVRINHESDDWGWFEPDDLPEPLHLGAEALFDDVDVEELLDEW